MITTVFPANINAGDDISWTESPSGYPVSGYKFAYGMLSDDGLNQYTIVQTGISSGLASFTVKGGDSSAWKPGVYYFSLYAFDLTTNGRTTISQGTTRVLADLSQTQTPSQNQRTLKAISDLLENKANDDIQTCSLNGKSLTAYSLTELTNLRTYYKGEVQQEMNARRLAAGFKSKRNIRVMFSPVGGGASAGDGVNLPR